MQSKNHDINRIGHNERVAPEISPYTGKRREQQTEQAKRQE